MSRNGIGEKGFYGVFLVFLVVSFLFVGARADESNSSQAVNGLQLSFAQWCSASFCNLRLFTVVGGELLMVDKVSCGGFIVLFYFIIYI